VVLAVVCHISVVGLEDRVVFINGPSVGGNHITGRGVMWPSVFSMERESEGKSHSDSLVATPIKRAGARVISHVIMQDMSFGIIPASFRIKETKWLWHCIASIKRVVTKTIRRKNA